MMTPPLFRWTLRRIVTVLLRQELRSTGGPVERQFMQSEHHFVKNTRTISIKDQRRFVEDIRIGHTRGAGYAPPHSPSNDREPPLPLDILGKN